MPKSAFWKNIKDSSSNQPFFSLAPMEAVTNSIFRQVVSTAASPDLFYTEFVNAVAITHPKAKFSVAGRLHVDQKEDIKPIVQIWGNLDTDFEGAGESLRSQGFSAIDLNTGCPDPTVVKNHAGSDLIRNPQAAEKIIADLKKSGLPVSVKTRIGFAKVEEFREWIPFLLKQDIEVLTIHLRTRKEMSNVPAHYELIDEIVSMRDEIAPDTLLQINGDIKNREQGEQLVKEHPGVDGVMIGRGVFEDPYAFDSRAKTHSSEDMLHLLELQLDLYDKYLEEVGYLRFETLRRFFKIYVRGFSNAAHLRDQLMNTKTTDEVRKIIAGIRSNNI